MSAIRSVWHVARECAGIAEGGGVKDVVRGLADAAAASGIATTVILPGYGFMSEAGTEVAGSAISVRLCHHDPPWRRLRDNARVLQTHVGDIRVWLVDAHRYGNKSGVYVHTGKDQAVDPRKHRGSGHWDAHQMNLLLQHVTAHMARSGGHSPDLIHCHDGHTAMLPALLGRWRGAFRGGSLITLHNAGPGYRQEIYGMKYARRLTGLPARNLRKGVLGPAIEPVVVGAANSYLNTVSPEYAADLAGQPLGNLLQRRGIMLHGITNGIDVNKYDPRIPGRSGIAASFDPGADNLEGKAMCRSELLTILATRGWSGLEITGGLGALKDGVLFSHVGRLARQKGVHTMVEAARRTLSQHPNIGFLILGEGEQALEEAVANLAQEEVGRFMFLRGYDADLAKRVYSAGDLFLVPSEYEPCGLTDLYAQMMGNIPIVHHVGGLKKVEDGVTGYGYQEGSGLAGCIDRALSDWVNRPALVSQIRRRGFQRVTQDYAWPRVFSKEYMPLYEAAVVNK